jgi:hypothetical protein
MSYSVFLFLFFFVSHSSPVSNVFVSDVLCFVSFDDVFFMSSCLMSVCLISLCVTYYVLYSMPYICLLFLSYSFSDVILNEVFFLSDVLVCLICDNNKPLVYLIADGSFLYLFSDGS